MIAGQAAAKIGNNQIKRIVGLNPGTLSYYHMRELFLQKANAKFVEIYSTTDRYPCTIVGINTCGHVNIRINGDANFQPGCGEANCDFEKAITMFFEAYFRRSDSKKIFATECANREAYYNKQCTPCANESDNCWMIGENRKEKFEHFSKLGSKWFYVNTNPKEPFWD